jgi:hypothetical protein
MGVSAVTLIVLCKQKVPVQKHAGGDTAGGNTYSPRVFAFCSDALYFQQQILPVFFSNKMMNQYRRTKQLMCVSLLPIISTIN